MNQLTSVFFALLRIKEQIFRDILTPCIYFARFLCLSLCRDARCSLREQRGESEMNEEGVKGVGRYMRRGRRG